MQGCLNLLLYWRARRDSNSRLPGSKLSYERITICFIHPLVRAPVAFFTTMHNRAGLIPAKLRRRSPATALAAHRVIGYALPKRNETKRRGSEHRWPFNNSVRRVQVAFMIAKHIHWILCLCLCLLATSAQARVLTVVSTEDSGPGTLRAAIDLANQHPGRDRIEFSVGVGPIEICPRTPLPHIKGQVSIVGSSQPGWFGKPIVHLSGECVESGSGLYAKSINGIHVDGLVVTGFPENAVFFFGGEGHSVTGMWVGVDPRTHSAKGNSGEGILFLGVAKSKIGGERFEERVVTSGNSKAGIFIGDGSYENVVVNTFAGLNPGGDAAVPNTGPGILIRNAWRNRVGGESESERVVTSGNSASGISIQDGSYENVVVNTFAGLNPGGDAAVPNTGSGIVIRNAWRNRVGGESESERVVSSGNRQYGLIFSGPDAFENIAAGSYFCTDPTGTRAIPNLRTGVLIYNAPRNTIGGATVGGRVLSSGCRRRGITIDGSNDSPAPPDFAGKGHAQGNTIRNTYLGVQADGKTCLPNGIGGMNIYNAQNNLVTRSDATADTAVLVSCNAGDGIMILGRFNEDNPLEVTKGNRIIGSLIGVDATGVEPRPNARHGVFIRFAQGNAIGGGVREHNSIQLTLGGRGVRLRCKFKRSHQ